MTVPTDTAADGRVSVTVVVVLDEGAAGAAAAAPAAPAALRLFAATSAFEPSVLFPHVTPPRRPGGGAAAAKGRRPRRGRKGAVV